MKKYDCPFGIIDVPLEHECPLWDESSVKEVSLGISTEDNFNMGIMGAYRIVNRMVSGLDLLDELDKLEYDMDDVIFEDMFEEDLLGMKKASKGFISIDYIKRKGLRRAFFNSEDRKKEISIRDREWRALWKRVNGENVVKERRVRKRVKREIRHFVFEPRTGLVKEV